MASEKTVGQVIHSIDVRPAGAVGEAPDPASNQPLDQKRSNDGHNDGKCGRDAQEEAEVGRAVQIGLAGFRDLDDKERFAPDIPQERVGRNFIIFSVRGHNHR